MERDWSGDCEWIEAKLPTREWHQPEKGQPECLGPVNLPRIIFQADRGREDRGYGRSPAQEHLALGSSSCRLLGELLLPSAKGPMARQAEPVVDHVAQAAGPESVQHMLGAGVAQAVDPGRAVGEEPFKLQDFTDGQPGPQGVIPKAMPGDVPRNPIAGIGPGEGKGLSVVPPIAGIHFFQHERRCEEDLAPRVSGDLGAAGTGRDRR